MKYALKTGLFIVSVSIFGICAQDTHLDLASIDETDLQILADAVNKVECVIKLAKKQEHDPVLWKNVIYAFVVLVQILNKELAPDEIMEHMHKVMQLLQEGNIDNNMEANISISFLESDNEELALEESVEKDKKEMQCLCSTGKGVCHCKEEEKCCKD